MADPADDDPTSGYVIVFAGGGKALLFHEGRCVHCKSCIAVCPKNVLSLVSFFGEIRLVPKLYECCGCFKCAEACPANALRRQ
ncbi:MAG: 4Fe-4S binding protein [Campylobacteraceae bacterium]|jgi:NAD-dependent dihydropyrimidine dehydrogenase PreA subunit|nr:4Fe-4S binding protein [Campylobacteraceae bacterium]